MSDKVKATPGPWEAYKVSRYEWRVAFRDGNVVQLDRTKDGNQEYRERAEADARLISKAWLIPEMQGAAKELLAWLRCRRYEHLDAGAVADCDCGACVVAREVREVLRKLEE